MELYLYSHMHVSDRVLNYARVQLYLYVYINTDIPKRLCLIQVVCHCADVGSMQAWSMWNSL